MASDIHALEIEFAKNPTLDACIPLCEAYLNNKRYMEAMVVCKKGIKNGPADPRGRTMLARVYLEQGKLPKAHQEVAQAVVEFPADAAARETMGRVLMLQGQRDEAVGYLQQALQADPARAAALAWLKELGVAATAPGAGAAGAMPPQPPPGLPPAQPRVAGGLPPQGRPQAPGAAAPQQMPPAAYPSLPQQQGWPGMQHPQMGQPRMAPAAGAPMPPQMGGVPGMPGMAADPTQTGPSLQAFSSANPGQERVASELNRPLEHVDDFFAPDTLGFSSDNSDIETAGPGRLTIVGFVPKSTGSIKTTIFVAVAVFAVAAGVILWQYVNARNTREINKLLGEVRLLMDDDKYVDYQNALIKAEKILEIDSEHNLTLSAMAYTAAVLGTDHGDTAALQKAKDYLGRAVASAPKEENEFRVAARALISYADKRYDQGIKDVKAILDKGGSSPVVELEAFRLLATARPAAQETKLQLRRLLDSVVSQSRIYSYLGYYYYDQDDWSKADKNFADAVQNTKNHPRALLGRVLSGMGRGLGLKERVKDFEKDLSVVFALKDELSQPTLALAYFARALVREWENKEDEAAADFKKAFAIDNGNPMFSYRRGLSALQYGSPKQAVEYLRHVVQNDPNNVAYYKRLAEAQIAARLTADAEASLQRAAQLDGKDVDVKLLLGDLKRFQKKQDEAIAAYKQVTVEDGGNNYARAQIGISAAMRRSGDKAKAVKFMETFLSNVPGEVSQEMQAQIWCELGQAYDATRNKEKAIETFHVGLEQYQYYADCHYFLCRAMGRGNDAKEACKRYLTLAPRGRYADEAKRRLN